MRLVAAAQQEDEDQDRDGYAQKPGQYVSDLALLAFHARTIRGRTTPQLAEVTDAAFSDARLMRPPTTAAIRGRVVERQEKLRLRRVFLHADWLTTGTRGVRFDVVSTARHDRYRIQQSRTPGARHDGQGIRNCPGIPATWRPIRRGAPDRRNRRSPSVRMLAPLCLLPVSPGTGHRGLALELYRFRTRGGPVAGLDRFARTTPGWRSCQSCVRARDRRRVDNPRPLGMPCYALDTGGYPTLARAAPDASVRHGELLAGVRDPGGRGLFSDGYRAAGQWRHPIPSSPRRPCARPARSRQPDGDDPPRRSEGGVYVIRTEGGQQYRLVELPAEFREEGQRPARRLAARRRPNQGHGRPGNRHRRDPQVGRVGEAPSIALSRLHRVRLQLWTCVSPSFCHSRSRKTASSSVRGWTRIRIPPDLMPFS